ncbi:hypothetical protein AAMO2058_001167200 [Amorphochlora amoebiformis]
MKEMGRKRGNDITCKHFSKCSGCEFENAVDYPPIARSAADFFSQKLGLKHFQIHMKTAHAWRTQAKLAVRRGKKGGVEIGLFEAGSHRLVEIPDCEVHHPSINEAVRFLKAATKAARISGYDEKSCRGQLRYVQMAVQRHTGKVQVSLVWNSDDGRDPGLDRLIKILQKSEFGGGKLWHSIWVNLNSGRSNVIFDYNPDRWKRMFGKEHLLERIGFESPSRQIKKKKLPFYFSPMVFRQGNLDGFERILESIDAFVPDGARICELYGGIGTIGLQYIDRATWLRFSDASPFLERCAKKGVLEGLDSNLRRRVAFRAVDASSALQGGQALGADVMIVDPPRKGLDEYVLECLGNRSSGSPCRDIKRLIYVSCGFEALRRDASYLVEQGWALEHAEGHILFPGSDHIETLAIFNSPDC